MRSNLVSMTCAGLLILSAAAQSALAQDGSSVMVQRDDEGGTRVMHFSMPNLEALRSPDFVRKDMPIFTERLVLSDAQAEAIARLIDEYVKNFQALTKDLATIAGPNAEFAPEAVDEGDQPQRRPRLGLGGGPGGGPGASFDDIQDLLPPGSSIGISVGLTMDDGGGDGAGGGAGGAPPAPQADVQVSVDTPSGEEIPQDVIDKIQERANEVAKQVVEQMQAQREARAEGKPIPADKMGGAVQMFDAEGIEAHQAELKAKIEEFLKDKAKLRSEFVVNAQTNLAEPQVARWPALERALTRARSLPKGRIAGESTDLLKVIADSKLSESQLGSLAPQIETYELALDTALKQRDEFLSDANQRIDQAIGEQKPDKAISIADRAADVRVAVRNVNVQSMEQMAATLGAEHGAAFRASALKAFYPLVYQQTRGQKMFAAIDKMEGLPADASAGVADLRRAYDAELSSLNDHIRQTIDREQPKERLRGLEQLKRTMAGEQVVDPHEPFAQREKEEDPIKAAMERRAELDDRYLKNVAAILPADKAAELPKPRTRKGPLLIRGGTGN